MSFYNENPNLKYIVIITASGQKEYRKNCARINNKYYIKDLECKQNDIGEWVIIENTIYDHELKIYKPSTYRLYHGIVGVKEDKSLEYGYFTRNIYRNRETSQGLCINIEALANIDYVEDISNDFIIINPSLEEKRLALKIKHRNKNFENCTYNIEENIGEFNYKINSHEKYPTKISKQIKKYSSFLENFTWGIEAETNKGYIPFTEQCKLGIVPCKDGSLGEGYKSCEFVTVPYQGAKGLQSTFDFAKQLSQKTLVDHSCSLHIHIGNVPQDRAFIVAYYKLIYQIQNELYELVPGYKVKWQGVKNKNYCKALPYLNLYPPKILNKTAYNNYINDCFSLIFSFFSSEPNEIILGKEYNKKQGAHPVKYKWNRPSRYSIVNLEPLFFSQRRTIECRLHHGVTNSQKIINWLFINIALIKYAQNNVLPILMEDPITLDNCLEVFNNSKRGNYLYRFLSGYVKNRKDYFKECAAKDDIMSNDLQNDKYFSFSIGSEPLFL